MQRGKRVPGTDATVAANRFGLGAAPGELAALGDDARLALRAQVHGAPPLIVEDLPSSQQLLAAALAQRGASTEADDAPPGTSSPESPARARIAPAARVLRGIYLPAYNADALARFHRAVTTPQGFLERLVHFWSNHFAVSVDKLVVLGLAGPMEREAIRPHVLGNFADMLLAATRHPAMLLYLDNVQSIGPASVAAVRAGRRGRTQGLNENLGREILELHTLGVQGGYTQQDVRELATILSGWSLGGQQGRLRGGQTGQFHFHAAFHEPGARTLLGRRYAEAGVEQGERALRDLALHPATARHLATKLARHFIADDPPAVVIEAVAAAYLRHAGDLPSTYAALLDAKQAWATPLSKFKTPADYLHSAWRALQLPVAAKDLRLFEQLGQRTWQPGSPAGWSDQSDHWDGAAALMKRLEWAQQLGATQGPRRDAAQLARLTLGPLWSPSSAQAVARAQDGAQALTLWLASPQFMRR